MKQGAITLVPYLKNTFVAIACAKGRGIILPGGGVNPSESLMRGAIRELKEETGLDTFPGHMEPLFGGVVDDYYVTTFLCTSFWGKTQGSDEGQVVLANRATLLTSQFSEYYAPLFDKYEQWLEAQNDQFGKLIYGFDD